MARIELTIDDPLLEALTRAAEEKHTIPSDYILVAVREALERDSFDYAVPLGDDELAFDEEGDEWGDPWDPKNP